MDIESKYTIHSLVKNTTDGTIYKITDILWSLVYEGVEIELTNCNNSFDVFTEFEFILDRDYEVLYN